MLPEYPRDTSANNQVTAALEAGRLRQTRGRVHRQDSVLVFYPSAAQPLHFVSSSCEVADSCTLYRFLGAVPQSEYWLVDVGYYEGNDYLLVHQRTGQHLIVDDYPSLSPSGRRVVSAANAYQDIYQSDGLVFWQFGTARPQLVWRRNAPWVPQGLRWADEHTLLIKANEQDTTGVSITRYLRLRFTN